MERTDKTLDIKGLISPRTEIVTGKTLSAMGPGQVLTVITTDAKSRQNIPHLCKDLGCVIVGLEESRGTICFQIQKSAGESREPQSPGSCRRERI